jgi:hypothetical protein
MIPCLTNLIHRFNIARILMGFDISSTFIDDNTAENGVWVDFYDEARLLIASTENPKYRASLAKSARANKVRLDGDPHPDTIKMTTQITCKAMADHVLLGWEGVTQGGVAVEYSKAKAYEFLLKSPQLREFVSDQAGSNSLFNSVTAEEVGKPSAGTLSSVKTATS